MKKFIFHIAKIALLFVGLLIFLDLIYTTLFLQTKNKSKLNWVMNMQNRQVDYIILGSSRVLFHLDTDLINDSTGLEGYNLGEPDYGLNESLLMLKLFYEQGNSAKDVFIQLDNNWNVKEPNELGSASFMPFIHKKTVRNHYAQSGLKYRLYNSIPFVRYMYYAHNIGFRGVLNALFNDRARSSAYGYDYLEGKINPKSIVTEAFNPLPYNTRIQELIETTRANNSQIIFFTAPILKIKHQDFDPLTAKVDNYTNFANSISNTNLFFDPIHLNEQGAEVFTKEFMHHYFKSHSKCKTDKNKSKTAHSIIMK
ncbi:MAG: hypothetical protein ACWA6U_07665 [Breznakibacter sp.]